MKKKFLCLTLCMLMVFGLALPVTAWSSGGVDHTHQYLTDRALQVLRADKGDAVANLLSAYRSTLLNYSDWPDVYENDGRLYTSHFYNPYTGKTFLGSTTALTRFTAHANNAKKYYAKNRTLAMQELGKALHYLADINEPHHAALLIAGLSNHTQYEEWVDANRFQYVAYNSSLYNAVSYSPKKQYASYCTALFRMAAFNGYDWADEAKSGDPALWNASAEATMEYAQESIAAFLFNYLVAVGAVKA